MAICCHMDNVYKTKDIFEASFLYSKDIPLMGLQSGGKYFWFVFNNPQNSQELADQYWAKRAEGNIKSFVDSFKTLKDLVFSKGASNVGS